MKVINVIGLAVLSASSFLVSPSANAAMRECVSIEWIDFQQNGSDYSLVFGCKQSNGTVTNMYSNSGSSTCSSYNRTLDTQKFWYAMVSGWSLAAKKIQIYYDSCGGSDRTTAISLRRQ